MPKKVWGCVFTNDSCVFVCKCALGVEFMGVGVMFNIYCVHVLCVNVHLE
mgnify:CR=1 FL=1